jgi:hypothetical protein
MALAGYGQMLCLQPNNTMASALFLNTGHTPWRGAKPGTRARKSVH